MPETICKEAILSDDFYDFLITPEYLQDYDPNDGYCIEPIGRTAKALYVPRNLYPYPSMNDAYYTSVPKLYGLMEGSASDLVRTIPQQQEEILGLTGEGVMIGLIGTGIQYESDFFKSSDKRTRILGIWDQSIQDGTPPDGFYYGSAYTEQNINDALASEDPISIVPSTDTHGYGTYLASVAAASENASGSFRGVAPFASIGVVKLKEAKPYLKDFFTVREDAIAYQENDIMFAVQYLLNLADQYRMPLILCLGLGTSAGNHNDGSFLAQYIDEISAGQRCCVFGTGNEAGQRHHFRGSFDNNAEYIDVEVRVENNPTGFWMELWGISPDIFTLSVISPSGETMPRVPFQIGRRNQYNFIFEGTSLAMSYQVIGEYFGNPVITMRMEKPANGIWIFRIYGSNRTYGFFHMWLPIQEFLAGPTYFLSSNPDTTLTDPSTTIRAISVSAYDSGNQSILLESGRGYALNGIIKPYFAAPGVAVPGIDLRDNLIRHTGTSESAAITAGSCALIYQWAFVLENDPSMGPIRLSTILIRGADQSPNRTYPNREWGYGTLNLTKTFENLRPV